MSEWIAALKPRDRVGVQEYGFGSACRIRPGTVERITETGRVVVDTGTHTITFNPNGRERCNRTTRFPSELVEWTPERQKEHLRWRLVCKLREVKWDALPLEKLREVEACLAPPPDPGPQ